MEWTFLVNFPQSGLEAALQDIREGNVTEYAGFDEMTDEIKKEDGKI
ncbi:MAG: hypothetical protein K5849_00625 [Bacteroidales bacterium]|nr:hypothetical protein [Bacteroidales bacterium]